MDNMIIKKKSVKRIIALVSAAAIIVSAGCIRNYRSVQAITYTNALIQEATVTLAFTGVVTDTAHTCWHWVLFS